jgi:hypothetical protein
VTSDLFLQIKLADDRRAGESWSTSKRKGVSPLYSVF